MEYNFKTYAPFMQRGRAFPDNVIRLRRTSMVVSANIMEAFGSARFTNSAGEERATLLFGIDTTNNAIQLTPSKKGYTLQCRANGNGYINTSRLGFELPIGDYLLDGSFNTDAEPIFRLAQ